MYAVKIDHHTHLLLLHRVVYIAADAVLSIVVLITQLACVSTNHVLYLSIHFVATQ